ncbi:MAG TPA: hypothetical protein PKW15_06730 [Alphaproteobacteria bacterium]|nr:hypothetical protein [Rhodospirillaceae bacterium]HRJ12918.1 hypothetical protein [Alphaproteobacteria bacterium]
MNEQMISRWQASNLPVLALCAAVLLHGLFSSPAPKIMGPAEILIALGLITAIAPRALHLLHAPSVLENKALCAWLWLLLVPLMIGLLSGHETRDTSRDLVSFCFLGLPVLVMQLPRSDVKKFALAIAIAGAAMAARYWLLTDGFSALGNLRRGDALLYLSLDPMMLFAAIYFPITLVETTGKGPRAWLRRGIYFIAAFLCWGALGGMMMRGALSLGILSLSLYAIMHIRRPMVPFFMGIAALMVVIAFSGPLLRFITDLWEKTQAVGLNSRDAEFVAIWKIQAADPFAFLFGQGWGAIYASPAVGGYWVNYSHSALGFYFLKTGVLGLMILAFYLLQIIWPLRRVVSEYKNILFAALPPLILSFTIYTSYKFLGCGILLLLLQSLHAHSYPQSR